ncbi:MAG: hypothetical protein AMXMBFR34_29380 [Myxococcaceae bacterium]
MVTAVAVLALALSAAPSPAELDALGRDIEAKYSQGVDGLGPLVDSVALADRTLQGMELPKGFRTGFDQSFKTVGQKLGESILVGVKAGARLSFRKAVTLDGKPAVQLRLLTPDGGFNVLELLVESGAQGVLKVVDVFDLMSGELKSQEIRRLALAALADANQGLVDKLMGKEQLFVKHLKEIQAMSAAARERRFQDVVTQFEALPRPVQEQRSLLRMYATAASEVDERKYERALGKYLQLYPTDAASNVLALDYYFMRKRWAEVEKAIGVVEARVGKDDGWFEVLRAGAASAQGKKDEARKHYLEAIAREKALKDPYFPLIQLALDGKDWAEAAKWLEAVERDAHVELQDVSAVPDYADFAASKEGKAYVKKWRAAHAKSAK